MGITFASLVSHALHLRQQPPPGLFPKCLQVLTALHTLTLPSRSSSGMYGDCFLASVPSPDPDTCYSTLYKVAKGIPQELKSDHASLGMSLQWLAIKPKSFLLLARAFRGQAPRDPSSPPGFLHSSLRPKCPLLAGLTHIFQIFIQCELFLPKSSLIPSLAYTICQCLPFFLPFCEATLG